MASASKGHFHHRRTFSGRALVSSLCPHFSSLPHCPPLSRGFSHTDILAVQRMQGAYSCLRAFAVLSLLPGLSFPGYLYGSVLHLRESFFKRHIPKEGFPDRPIKNVTLPHLIFQSSDYNLPHLFLNSALPGFVKRVNRGLTRVLQAKSEKGRSGCPKIGITASCSWPGQGCCPEPRTLGRGGSEHRANGLRRDPGALAQAPAASR